MAMLALIFVICALILLGISYFLVRRTSTYSRTGGDAYVRRVKRKMIGLTLLFPAMLLLAMAIGIHEASSPQSLQAPEAIATEPYVPPVLPRPNADDPLASREAPMPFSTSSGPVHQRPSDDIPAISAETLRSPALSAPEMPLPPPPAPALPEAPAPEATSPETSSPQNAWSPTPSHETTPAETSPPNATTDDNPDADLEKLNAQLKTDPNDPKAYGEIGNIYAARQSWAEAQSNYEKALALDPTNTPIKYNLAQMQFVQKKYDDARPGFAAIEKDMQLGDLALFKTFLCDLYGGHEDVAAKELDAFNQVGENASYYFANVAWSLYHKKPDDAQDWLNSANRIYSPQKFALYTADLLKLGYLPISPQQ